jgi:gliding motility-associated-like protein
MRCGKIWVLLLLLSFSISKSLYSQKAYINTPFGLYELTNGAGGCSATPLLNQCNETGFILSLAIYKDTVYYNTLNGQLKRFKIGFPNSCELLATLPAYNSMTIDKNGIIYLADDRLISYNPYTNQMNTLGMLPFASAGDLFYFNGKLLLAGIPAGIYEINTANTMASTLYMQLNNISFYGLISFPSSCNTISYYGLAPAPGGTNLMELDLANKVVVGTTCSIPLNVYDAASVTEGGINTGITVNSLTKIHPCPPATVGSVTIAATSTFGGMLTYKLDNLTTNTTGIFPNIIAGNHTISISAPGGCLKDTSFTITPGLNPLITIQKNNPTSCDNNNGTVSITASSPHQPISYKLINTGEIQPSGNFTNLGPGIFDFRIADANGCTKDTSVGLIFNPQSFVNTVNTREAHCNLSNGIIKIVLNTAPVNASSSLNNGPFAPTLEYTTLLPGTYYVQVKNGINCFFDTTVVIKNIDDVKPQIQIQNTDQLCFINNGAIKLNVVGNDQPYIYQLNDDPFTPQNQFINLAPANYALSIKNSFGCLWDTFAVVKAYPREPVTTDIQFVNPTCTRFTDGSISVTVNGIQTPYSLFVDGKQYNNGQIIPGLTEGDYKIEIKNNDQCIVETLTQSLKIPYEAHCNQVYIPTAFTPNNDGKNDFLQVGFSFFIKNLHLSIFNRYGQKIYEGKGSNISWDGTYKGVKQPTGVYVFMATYIDYSGAAKTQKGTIALIR